MQGLLAGRRQLLGVLPDPNPQRLHRVGQHIQLRLPVVLHGLEGFGLAVCLVQLELHQLLLLGKILRIVIREEGTKVRAKRLALRREGEQILFFCVNIHKIILL